MGCAWHTRSHGCCRETIQGDEDNDTICRDATAGVSIDTISSGPAVNVGAQFPFGGCTYVAMRSDAANTFTDATGLLDITEVTGDRNQQLRLTLEVEGPKQKSRRRSVSLSRHFMRNPMPVVAQS